MQKMRFIESFKEKFMSFYAKNKKMFFAIVALLIVLLFSFGTMFFSDKKTTSKLADNRGEYVSYDDYSAKIENKIEQLLSGVKSISKVDVFVMIETTPVKNYLKEIEKQTTESGGEIVKESIVFEKNNSTTLPIETFVTLPKITGVLIVTNKIDASTKLAITNALAVVLNVDESCISILQEK